MVNLLHAMNLHDILNKIKLNFHVLSASPLLYRWPLSLSFIAVCKGKNECRIPTRLN